MKGNISMKVPRLRMIKEPKCRLHFMSPITPRETHHTFKDQTCRVVLTPLEADKAKSSIWMNIANLAREAAKRAE
jgi:hypothetical protein